MLVLLVGMQGILGEIIKETLAAEPDMEIIGELADFDHPPTSDFACSDAVIACIGPGLALPRPWRQLLRQQQSIKFLIISEDGRRAALHVEDGHEVPIDRPSPSTVIAAIRGPAPLPVAPA